MKLSEFSLHTTGTIKEILENHLSNKLFEFGIIPGSSFSIVSKAPFKGPLFIQVDKNRIAIRRTEADFIIVE